jgi:hypothetical protein
VLNSCVIPVVTIGAELAAPLHHYFVTTNCGLLLSVPAGVTTETVPAVAVFGTRFDVGYGPKTYTTLSELAPAARIVLLIATAELYSAPATVTSEFASIFFQPPEGST